MIPAEARGAWRDIEARLRPYVARRVPSATEVDDIVQEILVRVHKGLATLRDGESFGGWVYRIAARTIADTAKSHARDPIVPGAGGIDAPAGASDEAADLQLELGECVALFVARLPSPYREAIYADRAPGTHAEGGRRDARHIPFGDEVPGPAWPRQDPRDVRGMLRDLRRLPRPRRGLRGAHPGAGSGGLPWRRGVVGSQAPR